MTNKEKKALLIIADVLEKELVRHNKNLTKKQYYAADDAVESIKYLINRNKKEFLHND